MAHSTNPWLVSLFLVTTYSEGTISTPGGGVCVFLDNTIPCKRLTQCEQTDVESLWISLRPHSLPRSISSIILCVIYHSTTNRQPENAVHRDHIRTNLDKLLMQPNSLVIITGDFNATSTGINPKDLTQPNRTILSRWLTLRWGTRAPWTGSSLIGRNSLA